MSRDLLTNLVYVAGCAAVIVGVAFVSWPGAWIAGGAFAFAWVLWSE